MRGGGEARGSPSSRHRDLGGNSLSSRPTVHSRPPTVPEIRFFRPDADKMPRRASGSQGGTDAMPRKRRWLSLRTSFGTAEGASTLALVVMVAAFAVVIL